MVGKFKKAYLNIPIKITCRIYQDYQDYQYNKITYRPQNITREIFFLKYYAENEARTLAPDIFLLFQISLI